MASTPPDTTQPLADTDGSGAVVCTLAVSEMVGQTMEWADLGALSLTSQRVDGGVASTYPIEMADAIEDLTNRELACCGSWLNVATERLADVIRLEITTESSDGLAVILSMTGYSE